MPNSIDQQYLVLTPNQRAILEPADEKLYQRLVENYNDFHGHTLVSCYDFTADWDRWELHPAGDEVVILLSGQATMVIEHEHGFEQIELRHANDFCLIPPNCWHTAKIAHFAKLLFVTPGAGTRHRDASLPK